MSLTTVPNLVTGPAMGFGPPIFSGTSYLPLQSVLVGQADQESERDRVPQIQAYIASLLSFSFLEFESAQRILLKRQWKDIQQEVDVSLPTRIANTVLFTTPLIVLFTAITSGTAQERRQRKCSQPLDTGAGSQVIEKFYFNVDADTCSKFLYKGKEGNENRFDKKGECEITCRPYSAEGSQELKKAIILSQLSDVLIFLSATILDDLGTMLYSIWMASIPGQEMM